jgi:hypothetical protein
MVFFRKARIAAFKARLQMCEAERRRIVRMVTTSPTNLAKITDCVDRVENDIRVLTQEMKLLEIPEPEE